MKALLQARTEGRVRYLGITGHHDPAILLRAMQEFDFDTVLIPLNAADGHRLSFRDSVLAEAARRNMGVIGMKSTAQGRLLANGTVTMAEAMGYVLSLPAVSTLIIGCETPTEVDENAKIARQFAALRWSEDATNWKFARCPAPRTSATSSGRLRYPFPPVSIGLPIPSSPEQNHGWGVGDADWKVASIHVSMAGSSVARNVNRVEREAKMKQFFRSLFCHPVGSRLVGQSASRFLPGDNNPSGEVLHRLFSADADQRVSFQGCLGSSRGWCP